MSSRIERTRVLSSRQQALECDKHKINIQCLLTGQEDYAQKSRQLMPHVISNSRMIIYRKLVPKCPDTLTVHSANPRQIAQTNKLRST